MEYDNGFQLFLILHEHTRLPMRISNPSFGTTRSMSGRGIDAALLAVMVAIGCLNISSGCRPAGPAVHYVEGVVLLEGEPIGGATVGFSPSESGMPAFGKTDDNGVFRLTTVRGGGQGKGAMTGSYTVTVTKWRDRSIELGPEPDRADTAAHGVWLKKSEELSKLPPDYIVPKAYGDKATSGLNATVKPGRNVGPEFRYELKGDFKGV